MREILFFIELFLLFIVFSEIKIEVNNNAMVNKILSALFFTIASFAIYSLNMSDMFENFNFQVSPEKLCDGGPYMWSSDPERQKMCSQFSQQDLNNFECSNGYVGRPVLQPEYIPNIPAVTN